MIMRGFRSLKRSAAFSHYYHNTVWDRKCGKNNGVLSCDVYNNGSGGIVGLGGGSKKN